jgi:hypothetical protein
VSQGNGCTSDIPIFPPLTHNVTFPCKSLQEVLAQQVLKQQQLLFLLCNDSLQEVCRKFSHSSFYLFLNIADTVLGTTEPTRPWARGVDPQVKNQYWRVPDGSVHVVNNLEQEVPRVTRDKNINIHVAPL